MFQLLAVVTLGPSLLLMWYFHSRDVYPEPPRVLWATFGLGVAAILPVLVVALPTIYLFQGVRNVFAAGFLDAFLSAAIPEEFFKYLVLVFYCSRHREFNEPMDGIVYGVAASLGFATLENVMYVSGGGLGLAVLRGFTAVPGHAFTGAIMGYYVGQARFAAEGRGGWMTRAYFIPMILHGLYDLPLLTIQKVAQRGGPAPEIDPFLALACVLFALTVLIVEGVWAVRVARRMHRQQLRDAEEKTHPPAIPAPILVAPSTVSPTMGWLLLALGGLLASGGALITLLFAIGMAVAPPAEVNPAELIVGIGVIGIGPLVGGIVLFWLGIRRLNAASRPARS